MTIRDLITSNRTRRNLPARREEEYPVVTLQKQINQMFDSFFRGSEWSPFGEMAEWREEFSPRIDVKESDKEIDITAELPGIDEKDIDVLLDRDMLTLKGEKREEKEEKSKNYWHMERRYGSFHRVIPLPEEIDKEDIKANFKKGILHIKIPKTAKVEPAGRKITIKSE